MEGASERSRRKGGGEGASRVSLLVEFSEVGRCVMLKGGGAGLQLGRRMCMGEDVRGHCYEQC